MPTLSSLGVPNCQPIQPSIPMPDCEIAFRSGLSGDYSMLFIAAEFRKKTMANPDLPAFAQNAINLASPRLGAKALFATDDFFADKQRMLADAPAKFDPEKYDDNGKYMDGWESRRRRNGGHDFCVVKLGARGVIRG